MPASGTTPDSGIQRPKAGSLAAIIRSFKIAVTKITREQGLMTNEEKLWQRSFFDRIIRNDHELGLARKYIVENPINWGKDKENPDRTD
ncbi:hypothetical protein HUU59_08005 [bacterium]|nr:hypothetical protein [bacterium]